MSESFEQMLNDFSKTIRNGETVEGTVISVKPDEIVLNIGYKSDGIITKREYSNDDSLDLTTVVKEGDTLEAIVTKINDGDGQVLLSYKRLAQMKGNEKLEKAFEDKEVLTAEVTQILNGGLGVMVDETRVFIPASLVSDSFVKDLNQYKGKEISFVITEFNPRRRRIIGDRKQLLVAEKAEKMEELLSTLKVGDVIEGTVKNVTDFGAFIDLGGVDGLLHISEISWTRVDNPKKVLSIGDKVRVFVKDINGTKIALSCKFPDEDPWANAIKKYPVGSTVTGKVARMTDFGAFVQIAENVDALLHVSQIAKEHVAKPQDVLKVGQEIEAKITEYKEDGHKISLSMKALLDDEDKDAGNDDNEDIADVDIEKVGNELANESSDADDTAE
ncbi:MAG: 30S ribosomal protein S1 [Lachnospiraceae bacterium]|nr:30S ribosomal protein S1 [Lachnospiraceae bacterium]